MDLSDIVLKKTPLCQTLIYLHSMHRGDLMEIEHIGSRAVVRVDNAELSELGLSFDSLRSRDISAKIFLAAVRAQVMNSIGAEISGDTKVSKCPEGVCIEMTVSLPIHFFHDPAEAFLSLKNTDICGDIYILEGGYFTLPEGCDEVIAAKIKEHGRSLCHTHCDRYQI